MNHNRVTIPSPLYTTININGKFKLKIKELTISQLEDLQEMTIEESDKFLQDIMLKSLDNPFVYFKEIRHKYLYLRFIKYINLDIKKEWLNEIYNEIRKALSPSYHSIYELVTLPRWEKTLLQLSNISFCDILWLSITEIWNLTVTQYNWCKDILTYRQYEIWEEKDKFYNRQAISKLWKTKEDIDKQKKEHEEYLKSQWIYF